MEVEKPESKEIEKVLLAGDLAQLKPDQRLAYYNRVCESLRLNPLTQPFEYIVLNGKMKLYATKNCTDQLREIRNVSVDKQTHDFKPELGVYMVTTEGHSGERKDSATGAVGTNYPDKQKDFNGRWGPHPKAGEMMRGDELANAMMKAETKSKRRFTLSICGLGFLDETEIETIADAIIPARQLEQQEEKITELTPRMEAQERIPPGLARTFETTAADHGRTPDQIRDFLDALNGYVNSLEIKKMDWDKAIAWAKNQPTDNDLMGDLIPSLQQAQFKKLYAIAGKKRVSNDDLHQHVEEEFKVKSFKELTHKQFNDVLSWLETVSPAG